MAVERIRRPYELLVRFRNGRVSGAHLQYEDVIIIDGEIVKQETDNSVLEAIDKDDIATHPVLTAQTVEALARITALKKENDELTARIEAFEESIKQQRESEAEQHRILLQESAARMVSSVPSLSLPLIKF